MSTTKILIVDDEYLERTLIKLSIDWIAHDFEIIGEADSGETALRLIEKNPPLVLILDIRLDGNLDGWQVLQKLKEKGLIKKLPIIISSALEKPSKEKDNDNYIYMILPVRIS